MQQLGSSLLPHRRPQGQQRGFESLRLWNSDFAANAAVFEVALTQLASWPHGAPTACPCLAAGYQAPDVVLDVRHPLDNTDGHRCAALAGPRHIHALDVAG